MSFSKRSGAALVCHSKPLDSVKNCNDHFFWVDATAFPLSMPMHKSKTLKRDPFPKSSQYNAEVYPTRVRVGEMEKTGDQVPLLEATRGCVVLLALPVLVTAASSEGNMTESIDRLFDEGNGAEKEHSTRGGEYVALTEAIVKPVNEDVAEKPKSLLDSSKLAVEIEVTATATAPLITSSVTPMLEREGGDHTDSVSGTNLWTKPVAVRFVISSDSSHHSGTHAVDVEVSSLVRSTVPDPPVMTVFVTTTAAVRTSLVSVSKVTDLNPKTLQWVYVPKWTVTNESYDQLYTEFNVGAARQTCLDVEVRMRAEHTLRKKKILEEEYAQQTNLLKENNAEIASLKSQLSLKEPKATEAIHLHAKMCASEAKATALKSKKSGLTDQ
ncbi:hypothetical protein Tco_0163675, partial [Tanacetum coccineum]